MPRRTNLDARRKKSKRGKCSLHEVEEEENDYEIVPVLSERDRRAMAAAMYEVAAHPENYTSIQE